MYESFTCYLGLNTPSTKVLAWYLIPNTCCCRIASICMLTNSFSGHGLNSLPLFKASALWADAFYKSKCPSVCLSVCVFVCSLLRYRLTVFLPPLPKVRCPIFLEIRNPWGKVKTRSGLTFEHFVWKWSKIAEKKKVFFCWFCRL